MANQEKETLDYLSDTAKAYWTSENVSKNMAENMIRNFTNYLNKKSDVTAQLQQSSYNMALALTAGLNSFDGVENYIKNCLEKLNDNELYTLFENVSKWYQLRNDPSSANNLKPQIESAASSINSKFGDIHASDFASITFSANDNQKTINLTEFNDKVISSMGDMSNYLIQLREDLTTFGNRLTSACPVRNLIRNVRTKVSDLNYRLNKCLKYIAFNASQKLYAIEGKYAEYDYKTFKLEDDYKNFISAIHGGVSTDATLSLEVLAEKSRQATELIEHNEELANLVHELLNGGVKDASVYSEYTWEQYSRYYTLEKELRERRPIAPKSQQETEELIAWLKKESVNSSSLGKSTQSKNLVSAIESIVKNNQINDMINTIGLAAQNETKVNNTFTDEQWKLYARYYLYDDWNRKGWDMPEEGVITDELINETVKTLKENYVIGEQAKDDNFADFKAPDNEDFDKNTGGNADLGDVADEDNTEQKNDNQSEDS